MVVPGSSLHRKSLKTRTLSLIGLVQAIDRCQRSLSQFNRLEALLRRHPTPTLTLIITLTLTLTLIFQPYVGVIAGSDQTFVNGQEVGATGTWDAPHCSTYTAWRHVYYNPKHKPNA